MQYKRIRDLREDKDLTQREMGEILIKLADFHHVSVDYILNRTDNPKEH